MVQLICFRTLTTQIGYILNQFKYYWVILSQLSHFGHQVHPFPPHCRPWQLWWATSWYGNLKWSLCPGGPEPPCSKSKRTFSVLQSGVIAIIAVALVVVTGLVIFAIWHRLGIAKRLQKERWALKMWGELATKHFQTNNTGKATLTLSDNVKTRHAYALTHWVKCVPSTRSKSVKCCRQLAEKVERFARKEAELAERGECVPVIYPDPSVPYEERCIMWYLGVQVI